MRNDLIRAVFDCGIDDLSMLDDSEADLFKTVERMRFEGLEITLNGIMAEIFQEGMYPDATIEHWWADEDMGNNDGYRVYQGGQIVDGDYCDSCSNEAYEVYIKCWGESECLYQDEEGMWKHQDCDTCHGCD